MKLLQYLRPIIEGDDNRPSLRRLIAIAFAIGFIRQTEHTTPNVEVLYAISGTMLVLLGFTTLQGIAKQFTPTDKTNTPGG